ncbi:glycoside hydrolase family 3 N-terminal domain-containing protein [Streptomyces tibetensis]|uniref:glycoside hydrolase family 3 N-terminal domain-containing protein n=1 Tax=Streptomyces tibetensis TaxID=2382123 RepID=UPI0033FE344D
MSSPYLTAADRLPFRDPALPMSKRVDDVLGRLTLDERIALLHQYTPAIERLGVAAFRTGTEALHGVSWLGEATVFPQAVGLGATWDEDLVGEVAQAVSVELRAFHRHRPTANGVGTNSLQAWAPVLNLLRDPRWGRNEEGYSEDPEHTARLGTAYCRGLAGDHPTYLRAAPVLKHFLAYNNEDDRCVTSSGLRPRVLQEYDLAAFRPLSPRARPPARWPRTTSSTAVPAMSVPSSGRNCASGPCRSDTSSSWSATPRRRPTWSIRSTTSPTTPRGTPRR